jgi:hypothetical protein
MMEINRGLLDSVANLSGSRRQAMKMTDTKAIRISGVKYLTEFKLRLRGVSAALTSVDLRELVHRLLSK